MFKKIIIGILLERIEKLEARVAALEKTPAITEEVINAIDTNSDSIDKINNELHPTYFGDSSERK